MCLEGFPRAPFLKTLIGCQRQRHATDDDDDEMASAAATAAAAAREEKAFDSLTSSQRHAEPLTGFIEAYELITCTSRQNLVSPAAWVVGHCLPAGAIVSWLLLTWSAAHTLRTACMLYENSVTSPADYGNWSSRRQTAIWLQDISFVAVALTSLPISPVHWILLSSYRTRLHNAPYYVKILLESSRKLL